MILYARVSRERNGERSKSVDDQLADLRAWAAREHWTVVGEYRDDGISASRYANGKERPGWRGAMAVIEAGETDALLVWDLSRASRDRSVSNALETACSEHGIQIGYGGTLRDPRTSNDSFYIGLDGLLAAKLSAEISEKVQRAVDSRAPTGRPHGALPYGYRRKIDPTTGRTTGWEIHPEQGSIVREIVRRLLEGQTANSIATDLNRREVPTGNGKQWISSNLSKMALRPAYAGMRVHGGQVLDDVEATWPKIITPDEHYRLKAMFGDPERDKYRNSTHVKHLGTGIYRCGRCDGRMRVVPYHRRPAYSCRKCYKVSRQQEAVDRWVEMVLIARLSRPDALDLLTGPDETGRRREAEGEVARLRAEEAEMQRLLKAREITPGDMRAWRKGWTPLMSAAQAAARPVTVPDSVTGMVGPDAEQSWRAAAIGVRRVVLDALAVVTILPTGRPKGGTPPPFDPELVRIEWKGTS